jgi:PAS domain S-box-containing protein
MRLDARSLPDLQLKQRVVNGIDRGGSVPLVGGAVVGGAVVASATLSRIYLLLGIVSICLTPLALLLPPSGSSIVQISQPLVLGAGLLAAALACRAERPVAGTVLAASSMLIVAISGAAATPEFGAEAMALSIIAGGMLVVVNTGRRMWVALGAVFLVGGVALVLSLLGGPLDPVDPSVFGGRVTSRLLTLGAALIVIGIAQRRLTSAMTQQAAAGQRLSESEARFRSLFTSSPNAILVADPAGRIVDASNRAAEVFGASTDILKSMTVDDFVPAAQRAAHVDQRVRFNKTPAERAVGDHGELSALRADGTPFPAEIGLSWFDNADGRFATIVVADVTARREAERAARDATETIRAIIDASPAGIAVTALDGTVRLWNRAMAELTGISEDDAIGRLDPSVPEERLVARAAIRAAVARNETRTGADLVLARKDSTFPAIGSFGPLHDAAGTVTGIVSVIEDVTAMRTLEAQVNRKARLESVGQLAGGIAHDINNVLTAIGGFASLSLEDLDAGLPVDREAIATIAEGAARTSALTRQLLAFARRDVRPAETIALGASVRAVEPMLRGLIGEHIALTMSTTDRGHVRIAGSQVEQLVINLVVNARDALPNGGTIRVDVANIAISNAGAGGRLGLVEGPYIALTVSDDGTGMPAEVAERVFDPFFTTKGPDEGTGLGLATVHGIVTEAGGHVSVETENGVGTTFTILLPLMDHVAAEPPALVVAGRGHETILLVEDEDLVRALASRVLVRAGFAVLVAAGAAEALALSADHKGRIDLLVTDVIMPRVLGPELALLLARERPGLGVLFTSGFTAGGTGVTASIPPDARFIDKPFSPSDLVAAVRAAIDEDALPLAG